MIATHLTSTLLTRAGFRHVFFTRRGGVSRAPWDSLSFAVSVGDDPAAVEENLERAARALGVERKRLYYLSQVHGVAHRVLEGTESPNDVVRIEGDITLSRSVEVGCGVRSADCVPILLADRKTGAVAAVHSGWRGTVKGAAIAGVRALAELAGGSTDIVAAIGPHIERCCFEVGREVALDLAGASSAGERAVREDPNDKAHVDLRAIVRAQLEGAGIAGAAIDDVRGCTVCDRESFHSYRRDRERSGRLLSAIVAQKL